MNDTRSRSPWPTITLYFVVLTAVLTGLVVLPGWMPVQASKEGESIDQLFWATVFLSVVILALVLAVMLYCIFHFRAKPGEDVDGEPLHGNAKLEAVWTIIPAIIVLVLGIVSWVVIVDSETKPKKGTGVPVHVRGFQFGWEFTYDNGVKSPELVVPVDKTIQFTMTAAKPDGALDVIHAFWVPEMRLKRDVVPGIETYVQWTAKEQGEWEVVCAELCGDGHNAMRTPVKVVSQSEYDTWLAAAEKEAAAKAKEADKEAA